MGADQGGCRPRQGAASARAAAASRDRLAARSTSRLTTIVTSTNTVSATTFWASLTVSVCSGGVRNQLVRPNAATDATSPARKPPNAATAITRHRSIINADPTETWRRTSVRIAVSTGRPTMHKPRPQCAGEPIVPGRRGDWEVVRLAIGDVGSDDVDIDGADLVDELIDHRRCAGRARVRRPWQPGCCADHQLCGLLDSGEGGE